MIDCMLSDWSWQLSSDFGVVPIWSITSLSYIVIVIDRTMLNWTRQFSFVFDVERTCMMGHVVVLSRLYHKMHTIRSILTVQYRILWIHTCMISHVIVLFGHLHRSYLVELDILVQFHFRCRAELCDRWCCCHVSLLSYTAHGLIRPVFIVRYHILPRLYERSHCCLVCFLW